MTLFLSFHHTHGVFKVCSKKYNLTFVLDGIQKNIFHFIKISLHALWRQM